MLFKTTALQIIPEEYKSEIDIKRSTKTSCVKSETYKKQLFNTLNFA
jgi:hypothetical protein